MDLTDFLLKVTAITAMININLIIVRSTISKRSMHSTRKQRDWIIVPTIARCPHWNAHQMPLVGIFHKINLFFFYQLSLFQVNGFPIYGTGQPSEAGYQKVLEKVSAAAGEGVNKMIWFNMRKEPVVYVNGKPFAPRSPDDLHRNLDIYFSQQELDDLEVVYTDIINKRAAADEGKVKTMKDHAFAENPMDREAVEEVIKAETIKGLFQVYSDLKDPKKVEKELAEGEEPEFTPAPFPGLEVHRIPVTEERSAGEACFDMMTEVLKNEPASVPCIFSDQMGRGRTTSGMVVACLIKELQITSELRKMEDIDLVSKSTVDDLIHQKFESPLPKCQDDDDPFIKGEFDVIKELLEKVPATVEGKKKIDRVIDICGTFPKGTGIQNLRECIIETKWKYDVATEDKQVAWKALILNFMERYFYLICFATYALEHGPGGYQKAFTTWMDEHKELRTMIEEGKDKLEWYRTVDAAKLEHLKELMLADNYKENLGVLIRTIYDFAFVTYADLPRGAIKNNSMRRLAATTLMEILPPDIAERVNKKMEEDPSSSHDFLSLVGMVSYYGSGDAA